MHIDHQKFLELLVDASGIEKGKVEKHLAELKEEVAHAITDGEAYEIEGLGIFSGLGNNILFIPSKELEIEINFKYVGMEPIEVDEVVVEPQQEFVDPFEELQASEETEESENRFVGLIEDVVEESDDSDEDSLIFGVSLDSSEEEGPGPDKWGIDAHKEDSGADKLFSSLMGSQDEAVTPEDPDKEESVEEAEEEFTIDSTEAESGPSLDDELALLMSEDDDDSENDTSLTSVFDEELEDPFGEDEGAEEEPKEEVEEPIIEEESEEEEIIEENEDPEPEPEIETEPEIEAEPEIEPEPEVEEELEGVVLEEEEDDDFDDPFAAIDDDDEDEDFSELEDEEIIPVITNISSDLDKKETESPKAPKPKKTKPAASKSAGIWLWMILVLFVMIGAVLGLAYFSIINIPGITPQVAITQPVQQLSPPTAQVDEPPVTEQETETNEIPPPVTQPEQDPIAEVPVQIEQEVPAEQSIYGLMGVASEAANNGYTVVIYSLSIEANALAKQRELANNGYRVLVTPINSSQYGTLWRVSLGQFETLVDAAIAGEGLEDSFKENYFIKKITN